MSLFKKVLSSVGIGAAKVDTVISKSSIKIGEDIQGVINITGGSIEQAISRIEVELKTEYIKEIDDKKVRCEATLEKIVVDRDIVIAPDEKKQISFSFSPIYGSQLNGLFPIGYVYEGQQCLSFSGGRVV